MNEMDREKFGVFLSELRKEQGLTQKEVAERLFVTDKAVSKWERGLSMPDTALLMPLADLFGVTVTELLRGERMAQEDSVERQEVEQLVDKALYFSREEQSRQQRNRKLWAKRYVVCVAAAAVEIAALLLLKISPEIFLAEGAVIEGLCLLFAAYFCFGAKETLPAYYDQNKINIYSDGIFRMNFPGLYFNNRNWPHILGALRIWMLATMVIAPLLYAGMWFLLRGPWFHGIWLAAALSLCLGFFIPVAVIGKKYE